MKKSKITFALIYWILGVVLMWLLTDTFKVPDYLIWIIGAVMGMFYWSTLQSKSIK